MNLTTNKSPKWFNFFYDSDNQCLNKTALKQQTIYKNNLLIARKINNSSYKWQFTKFINMDHFITFFNRCTKHQKLFYIIFTTTSRYLYLDIDYKINDSLSKSNKQDMIQTIFKQMHIFYKRYGYKWKLNTPKLFVWDATRSNKFSLHIIDTANIIHCKNNKEFAEAFNIFINNHIFLENFKIDNNVYHEHYQLWRLPLCHHGNEQSILTLYNNYVSITKQMNINCMVDVRYRHISYITQNNRNQNTLQNKKNDMQINTYFNNKFINTTTFSKDIFYKLQPIFNKQLEFNSNYNEKNEIVVHHHHCPLANRKHKNNSGRITLLQTHKYYYCRYTCMDQDCFKICPYKFYSLSEQCKRPWLYSSFRITDDLIIQQTDLFIDLLFKHKIIQYNVSTEPDKIFKTNNKIIYNQKNFIYKTFFYEYIVHSFCKRSNMNLSYKSNQHQYSFYGQATFYCVICKVYINLKNNKLNYLIN